MEEISTEAAPPSIGPFSQAVMDESTIYVSGQGPIDPDSGDVIDGDIEAMTARTLENIEAILAAADRSLDDVLRATVYVRDMDDYEAINSVYADYMRSPFPARTAVEVSDLPAPIDVEIDVIASR